MESACDEGRFALVKTSCDIHFRENKMLVSFVLYFMNHGGPQYIWMLKTHLKL